MKELKITKEKVLEASENCPDAREVLKTLFPEAFKGEKKGIGGEVEVEFWQASGENRYAIRFFYKGEQIGTLWADGGIDSFVGYKIEKDDTGGEYCFKVYKISKKE